MKLIYALTIISILIFSGCGNTNSTGAPIQPIRKAEPMASIELKCPESKTYTTSTEIESFSCESFGAASEEIAKEQCLINAIFSGGGAASIENSITCERSCSDYTGRTWRCSKTYDKWGVDTSGCSFVGEPSCAEFELEWSCVGTVNCEKGISLYAGCDWCK